MRYSPEHKLATHDRIVKRASMRLREKGAHGVGVADLMKDAGLTHGGFYAHFDSREALVAEAFAHVMDSSMEKWTDTIARTSPAKRVAAIVNGYLSAEHRDAPEHGCAIPSLGADMARESPRTRKASAQKVERLIETLAAQIPDSTPKAAREQAMAALSTMVGGLLLARLAGRGELSDQILRAGRRAAEGSTPKPRAKAFKARNGVSAGVE